jgi:hypothetical protein
MCGCIKVARRENGRKEASSNLPLLGSDYCSLEIAPQAYKISGLLSKKKILLLLMNVLSDQDGCPLQ